MRYGTICLNTGINRNYIFYQIKRTIKNHLLNVPGWRTKRKIVVIESDDWGAIRLPAKEILPRLEKEGIDIKEDHYIRNDALASRKDLNLLFDRLDSVKGNSGTGRKPVFTANVIMTNPDFDKIKADRFEKFHYELFTETLKKYPEHRDAFSLWKKGMGTGLFHPQFHGREHLHVNRWMKGLKNKESETAKAFELGLYALCTSITSENRKSYMAANEWDDEADKNFNLKAISEGLQLFKDLFGYPSESAIAPNYTWNLEVEKILKDGGVLFLQGSTIQRSPELGRNSNARIRRYTGQKNRLGQTYLVRNCRFEPASDPATDWVDRCLGEIKTAFFWKKPAVIESHRVNYIGYINPDNRDRNLKLLEELLKKILQTWPDVEFMTSDELGRLIEA